LGSVLGSSAKSLVDFKPYLKGDKEFAESSKVRFIDSSPLIGPFMHSKPDGCEMFKNFEFLGKSGLIEFGNGFRVAFLSGKDNDLYEKSNIRDQTGDKSNKYMGNYFNDEDIDAILEKYEDIVQTSGKKGVDLFI
jgi:hypothetical protein